MWYGTEEPPSTDEAGRLKNALAKAEIKYKVVPLPPELADLRPPAH